MNKELLILDFDKVQKEWIEEAKGMTDLEKVKYYLKKIQETNNIGTMGISGKSMWDYPSGTMGKNWNPNI